MNRINDWDKQILTAQDIARIFKCGKNLAYKIIERDAMKMGREAIKLLINRMAFTDRPKMKVVLDTKLIINTL